MAELHSLGDSAPFVTDNASEASYFDMQLSKKRRGGDVAAVFVHAGAGFHSVQNENVHLGVCSEYVFRSGSEVASLPWCPLGRLPSLTPSSAALVGMKFLKAGATAVEAVEAAIRVLEDNEITNAGYGSNLSVDGTVECDASIVDHHGRSGAVGAMGRKLASSPQ